MRVLVSEATEELVSNKKFMGYNGLNEAIKEHKQLTNNGIRCYIKYIKTVEKKPKKEPKDDKVYDYYVSKACGKVVGVHRVADFGNLKNRTSIKYEEITKEEYEARMKVLEESKKTYVRTKQRTRRSYMFEGWFYISRQTNLFREREGEYIVSADAYNEAVEKGERITSLKVK